jgi:hypothetical protein
MRNNIVLAVIAALMMLTGSARAEINIIDGLKKIPGVKQGVAFSLMDNKLNYLTTLDIVTIKGFNLEAGYAMDSEKTGHKAVAVLSYDLFNAKKAGITIPILDLIDVRPGAYIGYGRIEGLQDGGLKGEMDYGVSATILAVKF